MEGLYTNSKTRSDFVINPLRILSNEVNEIFIASAFYTFSKPIIEMLDKGKLIRMVVRLGYPTSPKAIKEIIHKQGVELRYFSNRSFHTKMYIFGMNEALVGSSNLTNSALHTNQEIMLSIKSDDPRFNELIALFQDYWDQAKVLDDEVIEKYEKIFSKYSNFNNQLSEIDADLINQIGTDEFTNIDRGKVKKSKESLFLDTYSKAYQETTSAFNQISEIYLKQNYRKIPEEQLPVRLEIDSFFSFVRDKFATSEKWEETEVSWNEQNKQRLIIHINEWKKTSYQWLEESIVPDSYPLIIKTFENKETIFSSTINELLDGLCVLHSFRERLRFFPGGLDTLRKEFSKNNDLERVKKSLIYLLHGEGDITNRMCDLIYNPDYKLNVFGESNVQELVGWVNKEGLPVINGRTTKILRYYGFNIKQL